MRRLVGMFAGLIALLGGVSQAADCPPLPPTTGQVVKLRTPLDEPTRLGLSTALHLGLDDPRGEDWPRDVVDPAKACRFGAIEVGGEQLDVMLGGEHAPPFWARTAGGRMGFLMAMPSIEEGYAIYRRPPAKGDVTLKSKPMFAMVIALGATWRYVTQVYDGIPPAETLKTDLAAALAEKTDLLAAYYVGSGAVSLMVPTRSNRNAVLMGAPPPEGPPSLLVRGDGVYFEDLGSGKTRMMPAAFVCQPRFGGFPRLDLQLINATSEQRDEACRYSLGQSWISIFVTRASGEYATTDLNEAVAARVKAAGGEARLPLSPPPGFVGAAWRDSGETSQAIMLQRRGGWVVEIRLTYVERDRAALEDAMIAIASEVASDIAAR